MPTHFLQIPAPSIAPSLRVGQLYGSSRSLLLSEQVARHQGLSVIVCCDMTDAEQLEQEIRFFSSEHPRIYRFPDLETLPFDQFSPHQDIVSERIKCLASIADARSGILILPVGAREEQTIVRVDRRGPRTVETPLLGCRFVKLIGREGWTTDSGTH